MGADIVIAVDVGTPLEKLDRNASLVEVISQMTGMLTTGNTRRQLATMATSDVLIVPKLGTAVATGDFDKGTGGAGHRRTGGRRRTHPTWRACRVAGSALCGHPAAAPSAGCARRSSLSEWKTRRDYADEVLLSRYADQGRWSRWTRERVEAGMLRAYSLGTLASITYEVVREDGRTGVLVRARPKAAGAQLPAARTVTQYQDFDGTFESDCKRRSCSRRCRAYGAEGRVTLQVGSEPGLSGEYYHPMDALNRNLLYAKARLRESEHPGISTRTGTTSRPMTSARGRSGSEGRARVRKLRRDRHWRAAREGQRPGGSGRSAAGRVRFRPGQPVCDLEHRPARQSVLSA